jgi:hypothetical protein
LAERQAVDPKNVHRRVQELERMAFGAIAPPCHVYPDLVLYRKTGLPFFQKLMTAPRTHAYGVILARRSVFGWVTGSGSGLVPGESGGALTP